MARYDPISKILCGAKTALIYNEDVTIGHVVLNKFLKSPNKVVQVSDDDGIELTSGQMAEMVINIAKNLLKNGLKSGDVAGFLVKNTTYVTPTLLACFLLRIPVNPVEVSLSVDHIVKLFEKTQPKILFCDANILAKVNEVLEGLEREILVVSLTERTAGTVHISELMEKTNEQLDCFLHSRNSDEKCAVIANTSGSSGKPKLARISHCQLLPFHKMGPAEITAFSFIDISWLTCIQFIIYSALYFQKRLITTRQFSIDLFCDLLERYKVNFLFLPPPHICLLMKSSRFASIDFSSVVALYTGGSYLAEDLRKTMQDKLTNGVFKIGYGLTEFGGLVSETNADLPISSSLGIPTPNTEVKVLLDDGSNADIGEIGEILARSKYNFLGYFEDSSKDSDDGWIHTGDMGFIDKNHEIHLIGQRTLMIKTQCLEVFPVEIEEIIKCVEGVKHVIVVGTPDSNGFEMPTALIVKESSSNVNEDTIFEATNHLPKLKRLRGGVYFFEELPINVSGKYQRNTAKELALKLKFEEKCLCN